VSALASTGQLIRFVARRERVRIPVYLVIFTMLIVSTAVQSEELYPTPADRADYVATVTGNPGLIAMVGPAWDVRTVGGDTAWQWGGLGAVVAALMSMFIVARHTRGEEQSGRSELIRASVVGREAPTAATLLVAGAANVLLGAVTALSMIVLDQPSEGSIAFGASLTGVGLLFMGVAAVAMQVSQSTSGAYGLVGAVLGAAYALRAAGDVGDGNLSWLSPIGWGQAMRPYAEERWWPLLLLLGGTAILLVAAFALLGRRDDGAGVVAPRPGPPRASPVITRPLGFALRLQRNALAGWAVGLLLGGVSIGLTAEDADALVGDSDAVDRLFEQSGAGSLVDNYLAVSLLSMALIGTGFALQAVMRARGEETAGRLEPLLATALARPRWLLSHVVVSVAGTVVVVGAAGLGTGVADAINTGDAGRLPLLLGSSLAFVPAVWVLIGAAVALFGLVPRAVAAAWGLLGASYLIGLLGPLLSLPDWVMDLSPFTHVPLVPAADLAVVPLIVLTAIATGLVAVGLSGFRRRDVPS
jgi:ABC-2 type transport system permease protein